MTTDELHLKIIELGARQLAMRDYVVWLMVREIHSSGEPQELLRRASTFVDLRLDSAPQENAHAVEFVEMVRKEKDWIVSAIAKSLDTLPPKGKS